jgi:GNAT superfamily N-acetyltransferase
MEFTIRRARTEDAGALAEILRSIGWFDHLQGEAPEVSRARISRHLSMCLASDCHSIYVAQASEETVMGYIAVHWLPYLFLRGPEGYIAELFVCQAMRNQGIGTALLETVLQEARRRGCARLALINTRTRESYERGFYLKHGWIERGDAASFTYDIMEDQNFQPYPSPR